MKKSPTLSAQTNFFSKNKIMGLALLAVTTPSFTGALEAVV